MALALASLCSAWIHSAQAQRPGPPGQFDYYLLTLSWSPSYCTAHGDAPSAALQCQQGRDLGFVEHGLWPQFEDGTWPYFCGEAHPLPHVLVEPMLAAIPSEALIQHEWRAHGTCSGLAAGPYLDLAKRAFQQIHPPAAAKIWIHGGSLPLADMKQSFEAANPGLGPQMFALFCDRPERRHVQEVRICLGKDLGFRKCGARITDQCAANVDLEPVPGAGNRSKHP